MIINIYNYRDYKKYLLDLCDSRARGFRKELATRARCQVGYITQVLSGKAHLNLDQCEAIAEYIGLDDESSDFFMLLLNYQRAATLNLKRRLENKIKQLRESQLDLKKKISEGRKEKDFESDPYVHLYYSSWHYAAVHVLVSSNKFQNREALSKALQMTSSHLNRVIDLLLRLGLIEERAGTFRMSETSLHLSQNSPLIAQHHSNWRIRALQSIATRDSGNFHFSSVFTMSREDAEEIRESLVNQIARSVKKAQNSPAIDPFVLNLDFFSL